MIDVLVNIGRRIPLSIVLVLHWGLFWLFNGIDKFANNNFGVTFSEALRTRLLPNIGIGAGEEDPSSTLPEIMAYLVGIAEIGLGVVFLLTLGLFLQRHAQRWNMAQIGITLSVLMFLVLSFGTIILGDRNALLQHGVFIATLLLTAMTLHHFQNAEAEDEASELESESAE